MKTLGYWIFAGIFSLISLIAKIDKKKVFCIMTHDAGEDSSVGIVVQYIKKQSSEYHFEFIKEKSAGIGKRQGNLKAVFSFFFIKPFHLATSAYVLQDNIFLPMAYLRFKKSVKVVQLWHGTGTIKKFGQSVNTGHLGKLEKRANETITHLIVNSEYTKIQYQEAFGVPEEKVSVLGLPRTDIMLDGEKEKKDRERFYQEFPELMGKKIVLYVPTFRDKETESPRMALDQKLLLDELPEEYVLAFRFHPFVAAAFHEEYSSGRIYNFSHYRDLNTLLFVCDTLITDYSSVIFEYCLLKKKMIFYAYDLDKFSEQGRGFYEEYRSYVPGPVVEDTRAIAQILKSGDWEREKIEKFMVNSYKFLDGRSTKRLFHEIFLN